MGRANKENVKKYITLLNKYNRPIYEYEIETVKEIFSKAESKLYSDDFNNLKTLTDVELCKVYRFEPREINPKYVGYVLNEWEMKKEEKTGSIIVVENNKLLRDDEKTDYMKMRDGLIKQIEN